MTCQLCLNADELGYWGRDHRGTHCQGCHRSWSSDVETHCSACHQQFSSVSVFDLHLRYCSPDAPEPLVISARKNGNPVFDIRHRADGPVWVRWREEEHWAVLDE